MIIIIAFIFFNFFIIGILYYLAFIGSRRSFCKEKIQNKKCTKLSKQYCVYKNVCKYAKRVEE